MSSNLLPTSKQRSLTEEYFSKENPSNSEYMRSFRVSQCPTNCKTEACLNAHDSHACRREPVLLSDGKWNYVPKACTNIPRCGLGDKCRFTHTKEELSYHPLVYKTTKCKHPLSASGVCSHWGTHCSFYHSDNDRRLYTTSEFSIDTYKTEQCYNPRCEDENCVKYHYLSERRRSLKMFNYRSNPCTYLFRDNTFKFSEHCPKKDYCGYAHSKNEMLYHPDKYQKKKCINSSCDGKFCAFKHSDSVDSFFEYFKKEEDEGEKALRIRAVKESEEIEIVEKCEETKSIEEKGSTEETSGNENAVREEKIEEKQEKLICKLCKEREIEWVFECGTVYCGLCLGESCLKCNRSHLTRLSG